MHNTALNITFLTHIPHGSTLLRTISPAPLTIILVFLIFTFIPLLSDAPLHLWNLSLQSSKFSLISTRSFAYKISFNIPFFTCSVTASTTIANINGDITEPWCTITLTPNSSNKPNPTLTFVLEPSYKLITAFFNTSGNLFFLSTHSITFLGTLSNAFSKVQLFLSSTKLLLHPSQNKKSVSRALPRHKAQIACHLPSLSSCSSSFTPLYAPQSFASPFPLNIGTTTLVFHSLVFLFHLKLSDTASLILQHQLSTRHYHMHIYFRGTTCFSQFHFIHSFHHLLISYILNQSFNHICFCHLIPFVFHIHDLFHMILP